MMKLGQFCSNNARDDIHAKGFWGRRQGVLFDISPQRIKLSPDPSDMSLRKSVNMEIMHAMLTCFFHFWWPRQRSYCILQPSYWSCIPKTWYHLQPNTVLDVLRHLIFVIAFCCASYSLESESCRYQIILLPPLNCVWWRAKLTRTLVKLNSICTHYIGVLYFWKFISRKCLAQFCYNLECWVTDGGGNLYSKNRLVL